MTMIHILHIDTDKYDMIDCKYMLEAITNILPEEDIVVAIPKNCNLYLDVPIETLYYYRQMFDDLIDERQRRNIDKNDL